MGGRGGTSAAGLLGTYSAKTVVTTTGTGVHCTRPLIPPALLLAASSHVRNKIVIAPEKGKGSPR